MGILDKVKGFLNVGGVSVEILQVQSPYTRGSTGLLGAYVVTSKSDQTVLSSKGKFVRKTTWKENGEEKSKSETLGTFDYTQDEAFPFDIKKGERKVMNFFMINVNCPPSLASASGVVGAIGMIAGFAQGLAGEKVEYLVEVTVDVKGTPFDPSATKLVEVVDPKPVTS